MGNDAIERRPTDGLRQKGQYAIGFGVIALMLYLVGFPLFMLVFFGALAFVIWKMFVAESLGETRRIFEFYLIANEILRDDERRWFGFEIKDAIGRGELLLRSMTTPPPLVHFALGALYQRIEDHSSVVRHLAVVVDEPSSDESAIMFPTKGLREYARLLRKIEGAPAESPQTSAAIRSLERARKNRASKMLLRSREMLAGGVFALTDTSVIEHLPGEQATPQNVDWKDDTAELRSDKTTDSPGASPKHFTTVADSRNTGKSFLPDSASPNERQTISEVLHDIYDENVQ
ncbi:MAG: hypothetical protein ACKVQW_00365 [Pyrinomonadaceae bacterium]